MGAFLAARRSSWRKALAVALSGPLTAMAARRVRGATATLSVTGTGSLKSGPIALTPLTAASGRVTEEPSGSGGHRPTWRFRPLVSPG